MDKLLERVRKTGEYAKPEEIPASPQQPEAPKLYVTSPVEAFVFELPEGKYRIRLVDPNGEVVPETQKNLVVFAPRRAGVGYEIIPESKWTRPVLSDDNSHVLYLEGRRTFYLKPSHELRVQPVPVSEDVKSAQAAGRLGYSQRMDVGTHQRDRRCQDPDTQRR